MNACDMTGSEFVLCEGCKNINRVVKPPYNCIFCGKALRRGS